LALRRNDPAAAKGALQRSLAIMPSAAVVVRLAQAQAGTGEMTVAEKTLSDWLVSAPADSDVRYALAELYTVSKQTDRAISELKTIVAQRTDHVAALNNLAWELRERDPAAAFGYAQSAFQLAPQDPDVMDTYAMLYLDRGEVGESTRILRLAAQAAPAKLTIRFHLARALVASGNKQEAVDVLGELLTANAEFPEREDARALLAEINAE
jgi:predicted Zn-dependent protease